MSPIIFVSLFSILSLFSAESRAQNSTPTPAPTPTLNFRISESKVFKIGSVLLNRLNTINLDSISAGPDGIKRKSFYVGISGSGAIVYCHEIREENISRWSDIGKNAGPQVIRFDFAFYNNHTWKASASGFSLVNMNILESSRTHGMDANAFNFIDRVDFGTLTIDNHVAFNNLKTTDLDIVHARAKYKAFNQGKNYLSVNTSGNIGGRFTQMDHLEDLGYSNYQNSLGWKLEYTGGLELNLVTKKDIRLNLQAQWVNGFNQIIVNNHSIIAENELNQKAFEVVKSEFNSQNSAYLINLDQWKKAKVMYEASQGGANISDQEFANAPGGYNKPSAPAVPQEPEMMSPDQDLRRNYGYIKSTIDLSMPVKIGKRGTRLGASIEINQIKFDHVRNPYQRNFGSAPEFNLKINNNQLFRVRVYITF